MDELYLALIDAFRRSRMDMDKEFASEESTKIRYQATLHGQHHDDRVSPAC